MFAAACRMGSVAAAAREEGLSRRAALRLVRELEDEEGGELFLRTQWGVLPTALGRGLLGSLEGEGIRCPVLPKK